MQMFWQLVRVSFDRQITYRAAALAGLLTNFFFGLLRAAVLVALYGARQQVAGMTVKDAITYTGLTQGMIGFLSLFGWYDMMRSVYTGSIGSDLLKPMDYFTFWMAQDLGRGFANLLMRTVPILVFYALYFGISTPGTPGQWLFLLLALALSWMISFSWRFLVNLAAFWSPNAVGFGRLIFTLAWFSSGFLIPLRFLPDWFQRLCYLTPFPQTINTVIEVYLGLLDGSALMLAILSQVFWVAVLIFAGQFVLRAGVRRLVIQGG